MSNQSTIEQIDPLAILAEHAAAAAEMARVKRFTGPATQYSGPLDSPTGPYWPEMDQARARLAALPTPPSRAEAIAACVAEIERLAAEFTGLWAEYLDALRAEMDAAIEAEAAKIRHRYARVYPALGLPTKNLPMEQAESAKNAAEYRTKVDSTRRDTILRHVAEHYPGADLARPETFSAAAAGRVDRTWGEFYDTAEAQDIKTKLGLTDKMLARLVKT